MEERYRRLNEYYKSKFGQRTLKLCLDGGFTCPNRDGSKGVGGCFFCGEKGAGERLGKGSIRQQVKDYFNSYHSQRASSFLVYFQNFSSSYDSIENLKAKYDAAFADKRIIGLDIDTRADCVSEEFCLLLNEYQKRYYVVVELGLQCAEEKLRDSMNQCLSNQEFLRGLSLLNRHHIDVVIHLMVGLPKEDHEEIVKTMDFLAGLDFQGIKIHSTYVLKETPLGDMYQRKEYFPISMQEYVNEVCYILTHLNPEVVIHRLSGDPPKDLLLAPEWSNHKKVVLNEIHRKMEKENWRQGCFYSASCKK